jgi:glycosyltransferase involved in cell wall biosynthesis
MADFVLLATADWDQPLWTNKQHLAITLAALGHRVLYVESLGLRGARRNRGDLGRIVRRLWRGLRPPHRVRQGLWVWSPLVLPGGTAGLPLRINRRSLRFGLGLATFWVGFGFRLGPRRPRPLLWTFNPLTADYLPSLKAFRGTIYNCVDRVQAQPGMPSERIERAERDLCSQVDVVFTTAPRLQQSLAPLNPATYLFGNVADAEHFAEARSGRLPCPPDLEALSGPLLMFIGAIDAYKVDLLLLEHLAGATPQWTYVLIGPVGQTDPATDVAPLRRLANVHLLGPRPYADLPAYLARADVALLPLRLNDYTRHMFPMKFFEYLAAGCPVVASSIPSLLDQSDVAWLCAPLPEEFAQAITSVLAGAGPGLHARLERAAHHTYRKRTEAMLARLQLHGLLPSDGDAGEEHRLYAHGPGIVLAQFPVALAGVLQRLGRGRSARLLLQRLQLRWPQNPALLSALAPLLVAAGEYGAALECIEGLWRETADVDFLHRLLFRRGARPAAKPEQLRLFATLASSDVLPRHYTGYCRVVATYRAVDSKDPEAIRESLQPLEDLIRSLEEDPGTFVCLRPNRENRAKLLISAQLARLRACLVLKDWSALDACARSLMGSVERYRPETIDANTAARMTRNILRCLSIEAFVAWGADDAARFGRALDQMERMTRACALPALQPYIASAQEDHPGFAAELARQLGACRWDGDRSDRRPPFDCLIGAMILVLEPRLDWSKTEKVRRTFGGLAAAIP